jgi:hypothetical protein
MASLDSNADPGRSTIYLFGELDPRELALFDLEEILTDPSDPRSARVEVIGHGIGYWLAGCTRPTATDEINRGERLLRLTMAIYAALGGEPFRVRIGNWLEAKGVTSYRTMMGFQSPRFGTVQLLPRDEAPNRALRESVMLATLVDAATPSHRLALFDLHTALLDPGVDAILYAYRAVESTRLAIAPAGTSKKAAWAALNARLETNEDALVHLQEVASAIRHGDHSGPEASEAVNGQKRAELLDLARDVVTRELAKLKGRDIVGFG